jgi:hypothetical protein
MTEIFDRYGNLPRCKRPHGQLHGSLHREDQSRGIEILDKGAVTTEDNALYQATPKPVQMITLALSNLT